MDQSDNAGCYSSAVVIAGKAAIATKKGFNLMQTEFNEPQKGKDQRDRDVAVIKKHIKSYKYSGKDVTTAKDCFKALSHAGGVGNVKPSVVTIQFGTQVKIRWSRDHKNQTVENAFSVPWYYSEMELEPVAG